MQSTRSARNEPWRSWLIPYDKYEAVALIRAEGRILSETHEEDGTRIRAQLPQSAMHKLKRILGGNDGSDAEKTE